MYSPARHHIAGVFVLIIILSSISANSYAQDKLELIHANELRNVQRNGKNVQQLDGAVQFRRGKYDMYCDNAIRYEATDISIFWGNVRVYGKSDTLTSDSLTVYNRRDILYARGRAKLRSDRRTLSGKRIRYYTEKDEAHAAGNVEMQDRTQYIEADSVWYNRETEDARIYGKRGQFASVYDSDERIKISGPVIVQNLKTESLKATLRPVLTKLDSSMRQVVRIKGNTITGNPDSGRYVAREEVVITRDSMRAETELARFIETEERAILEKSPVVYYTENIIRGETIHLSFEDDKLKEVYIPKKADVRSKAHGYERRPVSVTADTTTSREDSVRYIQTKTDKKNLLQGTELNMWLEKNKIQRIRVRGMATSSYHVFEDSLYQGLNEASGDTIILTFAPDADSLQQIDVIGGTRGTFSPHKYNPSVDTTIYYEAHHIIFQVPERITNLKYDANTKYKNMQLQAAFIDVFWNKNLLVATPLPDSADTTFSERNIPVFSQTGQEPMTGNRLEYNLKTKRGRVIHGETTFDDGFYTGSKILKRGEKTLYVNQGIYTTCELDWPHYHFESDKMKLLVQDKVIARPIVLYIHDVPIFALPFGVFPQKRGRRNSGYILPTWGEGRRGRYLKGLGYFWAPSDYWDYKLQFDFWEEYGVSIRQRIRYNKRYSYNGNIGFDYDKQIFNPARTENYKINVRHSQIIDPTTDLRVNASYVSSREYIRETNQNRQDRLQQQVISNATLSKRWEDTKNSMSVNLQRTENLQSGNITEVLPQVSFRRGTDKLIKAPANASYQVKNRWFYNINYSYSANFRNRHEHKLIKGSSYTDPYGRVIDLGTDSTYVDEYQRAIQHNLSFSNPRKILKFFSFNPSLNINEDWVPAYREPVVRNGSIVVDTLSVDTTDANDPKYTFREHFRVIHQPRARHTFNFSFGTSTKLYGLFAIPFGPVKAIRHVLTPSVNYNIGPDFSDKFYGYYYYGTLPDGREKKYDRFLGAGAGGTRSSETQSVSLSLRNLFQAKYLSGSGEDAKEQKIDFLTWNMSTGYNFVNKEKPWNTISSSMRASLGRQLSLQINMRHDPYRYNSNQLHRIPRMTNLSVTTGFSLSGKSFRLVEETRSAEADTVAADTSEIGSLSQSNLLGDDLFASTGRSFGAGKDKFWSVRLNFRYSINRNNPNQPADPTFWINTNTDVNISRNWSVSMSSRFDMAKREMVSTDFTIKRDLHCWEMYFTWTPTGWGRGYYLKINVKSPSLQDVKVESRGGRMNY